MWTEVEYYDDFIGQWSAEGAYFGGLCTDVTLTISDSDRAILTADGEVVGVGEYNIIRNECVFGMSAEIGGVPIVLLDATKSSGSDIDILVRWRQDRFYYPFTTRFRRD
jgi:hypothetical protein